MWIKVLGIATTCLLLGAIAIGWQGDVEAQDLHRKSNPKPDDTAKPEQVVRAPLKKGERIQLEMLPSPLARIVARQEADRKRYGIGKLQDRDPSQRDKGVFNMSAIWGPEVVKLRVCFVSGVRSLRAGVAAVALEWTAAVPSLPKLDFGNPRDPRLCAANAVNDIRISFNEDEDSFSLSGSQSILNLDLPSMNFSGISTRTSSDPIFRTTVLHEFGHAFGLEHEHQHPDGTCDAESRACAADSAARRWDQTAALCRAA